MGMLLHRHYQGQDVEEPREEPKVTEEEIMAGFLKAVNEYFGKDYLSYCRDYETHFLPLIGETKQLDDRLSALTIQRNELASQIERLIDDNAKNVQNQNEYSERFNQLSLAMEDTKASIKAVEKQISDTLARRENVRIFLQGMREAKALLTQFDIRTWHALADYVKVMPD